MNQSRNGPGRGQKSHRSRVPLRQSDFEALVEERACSECQGALLEAMSKR